MISIAGSFSNRLIIANAVAASRAEAAVDGEAP